MEALKPCPFCGGEAKLYDVPYLDGQELEVASVNCAAEHCRTITTHGVNRIDEAIRIWNTRTIEDALRARIAQLEAVVEAQNNAIEILKEWGSLIVMNKNTDLAKRVDAALQNLDALQSAGYGRE